MAKHAGGAKRLLTVEEIAAALHKHKGLKTHAARELGVTYQTIQNYFKRYPDELEEALKAARVDLGDTLENRLYQIALADPPTRESITALIFVAKTHPVLRERGFTQRPQVEINNVVNNNPALNEKITELLETLKSIGIPEDQYELFFTRAVEAAKAKQDAKS